MAAVVTDSRCANTFVRRFPNAGTGLSPEGWAAEACRGEAGGYTGWAKPAGRATEALAARANPVRDGAGPERVFTSEAADEWR